MVKMIFSEGLGGEAGASVCVQRRAQHAEGNERRVDSLWSRGSAWPSCHVIVGRTDV